MKTEKPKIDFISTEELVRRGVQRKNLNLSVSDFKGNPAAKKLAIQYCKNLSSMAQKGYGLYIHGPMMGGADIMSDLIVMSAVAHKIRECYSISLAQLNGCKYMFDNEETEERSSELYNNCLRCGFLAITNITGGFSDQPHTSDAKACTLHDVLLFRYGNGLPTVLTSRIPLIDKKAMCIQKLFGEDITNLIRMTCAIIACPIGDSAKEHMIEKAEMAIVEALYAHV